MFLQTYRFLAKQDGIDEVNKVIEGSHGCSNNSKTTPPAGNSQKLRIILFTII